MTITARSWPENAQSHTAHHFRVGNPAGIQTKAADFHQRRDRGITAPNYEASNESYADAVSILKNAIQSLPSIRFAGVAGGGDAFLALFGALASHAHFQSSTAFDVDPVQLTHLYRISDQISRAVSDGKQTVLTIFTAGGALQPDLYISQNHDLLFTSRFSIYTMDGTDASGLFDRKLVPEMGGEGIILDQLAGRNFYICDFDGDPIGEIEVSKNACDVYFLQKNSRTRLTRGTAYGFRNAKRFANKVPITKTINGDIEKYLRTVPKSRAQNVIYLSNIYNPSFNNGWGGHPLYYIAREKKFEEGTIIIESHNMALYANVLVKRDGRLLRVDHQSDGKAAATQDALTFNPYNISDFPSNPYANMRR